MKLKSIHKLLIMDKSTQSPQKLIEILLWSLSEKMTKISNELCPYASPAWNNLFSKQN